MRRMSYQEVIRLGDVAMFIGAALNHPLPPCNGLGGVVSTIKVSQYKVKFSEIRVYCRLADQNLIDDYWRSLKKDGPPTEEFAARCLKSDACHYRQVYTSMLRLLPSNVKPSIVDASDYRELLYDTPTELTQFIDSLSQRLDSDYYLTRWKVPDIASLKELLFGICRFSTSAQ